MRKVWIVGLMLLCMAFPGYTQQPVFKSGETVCFVGNSITFNGDFYHQIALFRALRYPQQHLRIYNCGIGGNMAADVLARLDEDVLDKKPQLCVLKLGMNDVHREFYAPEAAKDKNLVQKRDAAIEKFRVDYEMIIKRLLAAHCRVVLQTPTIYDQTAKIPWPNQPGRNDALGICAQIVAELGEKYRLPVIDYWHFLGPLNKEIQLKDSTATLIGPDRVHPGPVGHFLMAYRFLSSTGEQPWVSQISIGERKAGKQINAVVTDLKYTPIGLEFDCLENALPFPAAGPYQQALALVPFHQQLNQEQLKITGLPAGHYELSVDGVSCGRYTEQVLAGGLNLALIKTTPQYRQAESVRKLFEQSWKIEADLRFLRAIEFTNLAAVRHDGLEAARGYFEKTLKNIKDTTSTTWKEFRNYQTKYLGLKPREAELVQQGERLWEEVRKAAQPVSHHFSLKRDER